MASRVLDYALWPLFFFTPIVASILLLRYGVPDLVVQTAVIGVAGFTAYGVERVRPEHPAQQAHDFPVWMEIGHFLIGVQLGSGLAMLAAMAIAHFVHVDVWPNTWPIGLQLFVAIVMYEGTSYWQHRFFHRSRHLWGFHALHHSGPNLNILRGLRFHGVDLGLPTFVGYLPFLMLGAPARMVVLMNVVISAFGITQHANIRMRTPRWLDAIICTPVLHRRHHARSREESECNYGTTVMIWDRLFGTFQHGKTPDGPEEVGIEKDTVPRTFWKQIWEPFKGA